MTISKARVEAAVKSKGYVWFDSNKDYDLNIVGIRNSNTKNTVTNRFDDWITVAYKVNGVWQFHAFEGTTDPGITYTQQKLLSPLGVARLVPGQYRGSHTIGMHQGKYRALVQQKPLKVFRDANRDAVFDEKRIEEGMFGINIHRSSPSGISTQIDGWSAGCQVFANIRDFTVFMTIATKAYETVSKNFTYTLITSNDLP